MPEREISLTVGSLYEVVDTATVFVLDPNDVEAKIKSAQTLYGAPGAKAMRLPIGTACLCVSVRLVDGCWVLTHGDEWVLSDGTGLQEVIGAASGGRSKKH